MAAEQGREVFAVPGSPLDPRADGTNDFLKHGATLVTEVADILDGMRADPRPWPRGSAGARADDARCRPETEPGDAATASRIVSPARAGAGRDRRPGAVVRIVAGDRSALCCWNSNLPAALERHGGGLVSIL